MWRIVWIRRSGLVYPCPYPANLWININSPIPSACFGAVAALRYLFDIVANQHSGVDVDKFDYLARYSHHLGVKLSFDHRQTMQAFKVWVCVEGEGPGGEGRGEEDADASATGIPCVQGGGRDMEAAEASFD